MGRVMNPNVARVLREREREREREGEREREREDKKSTCSYLLLIAVEGQLNSHAYCVH